MVILTDGKLLVERTATSIDRQVRSLTA